MRLHPKREGGGGHPCPREVPRTAATRLHTGKEAVVMGGGGPCNCAERMEDINRPPDPCTFCKIKIVEGKDQKGINPLCAL